ncbi:LytTR family DNA-binding domain-containing protein [Rubrivivax albus]|nr:LytTR family DNA-binding domain-containing protein [Rubrivivax albus]
MALPWPPAARWQTSAGAQIGVIAAVLVLALAWMQPEGGAGLGFLPGLLFHGLHIGLASAVAWWCSGALLRTGPGRRGSPWPWLVLAGAVAGIVLAPVSLALEQVFGVAELDAGPVPGSLIGALVLEWQQVVPITALLWPAMNLLVVWRQPPAGGPAAPPAPAPDPGPPNPACAGSPVPAALDTARPSFLDRLPAALGRDVVWLQAQEHYLLVTTTMGRHLLLQAFGPAMDDLARLGVDGMQTHRSAWVAWGHVQRLDTRARSPAVVLLDGTRVPLGRRRLPQVAAAWAERAASADPAATMGAPEGEPT